MRDRIAALDGLRALAAISVVGAHAGVPGLVAGGGLGVDVFFVLSGFLITTLLLNEHSASGTICLRAFYLRRTARLLPALAVCTALTSIADLTADLGGGHLTVALPSVLLYVANWVVSFDGQALGFFGQAWSLSIEEQFYLLWPLVVLSGVFRTRMRAWLPAVIVAVIAVRGVAIEMIHAGAGMWTPLHADGLLLGAWLAVAMEGTPVRFPTARVPAWLALPVALSMVAVFVFRGHVPLSPIDTAPVYVSLGTAVIITHVITRPEGMLSRLLSLRYLRAIGLRSYGIYLYHYPLVMFTQANHGSTAARFVAVPAAFLMAMASWKYVEQPIIKAARHRSRKITASQSRAAAPNPDLPVGVR